METKEFDAICLKAIDYGENDKILTLYAAGEGKVTVSAKGCKKPKAKLKFAACPLCFGHYYISGSKNKQILTGCDVYDSFFDITIDPVKYYASIVILEILDKMVLESDYNNTLFVTGLKCIKELCYESDDPKITLFKYLKQMFAALGYECKAITFIEYYNYLLHNFNVEINSLKEITRI